MPCSGEVEKTGLDAYDLLNKKFDSDFLGSDVASGCNLWVLQLFNCV